MELRGDQCVYMAQVTRGLAMSRSGGVSTSHVGALAFGLAVLSSLVYYLASDGVRFLLQAIASGGRTLLVGF